MTCRPGHAPRHPDFETGNVASLSHGLFRARRAEAVAAEVEEIAEHVALRYPWTAAYVDERRSYARAVLDERDVRRYLDEVGVLDDRGRERSAVRTLDRFVGHARHCRAALGLTPASHAHLLRMVAEVVRLHPDRTAPLDASLDALLAEGRAALERGAERRDGPQGGTEETL